MIWISIPVWGEWYHRAFHERAWPAIDAMYRHAGKPPARVVFHGDRPPNEMHPTWMFIKTSQGDANQIFIDAHKEVLSFCEDGDVFIPLAADLVPSSNALAFSLRRIDLGARLIACAGTRTLPTSEPPPWSNSEALQHWAWDNRHPLEQLCTWPAHSAIPSRLYFETETGVIQRPFHLHPFACRITDEVTTNFRGTVDDEFVHQFPLAQIHIVTDPSEMAMIEISPPDKQSFTKDHCTPDWIASWANRKANTTHKWFFTHRIRITGQPQMSEIEARVTADIVSALTAS
jgi:hypothetical protein